MKLQPPLDENGRPVMPPMEELFPAVHDYFLKHRWKPEPLARLVPPGEARRRWGDEPWRQFLPDGATHAGAVWSAKLNYKHAMLRRGFNKRMVDFLRLHLSCDRKGCRRAKACAMIDVDCYYVVHRYMKAVFYPGLRPIVREHLAQLQATGAWDPDAEPDDLAGNSESPAPALAPNQFPSGAGRRKLASASTAAADAKATEDAMSKGRDRPGKEKRKPKADKNKKKKGVATPPPGGAKPALSIGANKPS